MAVPDMAGMSAQAALRRMLEEGGESPSGAVTDVDLTLFSMRLLARSQDVMESLLAHREESAERLQRSFEDLLEKVKEITTNTGDQADLTGDLERAVRNLESAVKDRK